MDFCRLFGGWRQTGGGGHCRQDLHLNQFRSHLDAVRRSVQCRLEFGCLLGGWRQIGGGEFWRRSLYFDEFRKYLDFQQSAAQQQLVCGGVFGGWNQTGRRGPERLDLLHDQFRCHLDFERCAGWFTMATMAISRLLGRRQQTGGGGGQHLQRRDLDFADHSRTGVNHLKVEWQTRIFVDCAFDEFHVAAEFRSTRGQLDERDEHASAQSHEFTKSNFPAFAGG